MNTVPAGMRDIFYFTPADLTFAIMFVCSTKLGPNSSYFIAVPQVIITVSSFCIKIHGNEAIGSKETFDIHVSMQKTTVQ